MSLKAACAYWLLLVVDLSMAEGCACSLSPSTASCFMVGLKEHPACFQGLGGFGPLCTLT